MSVMATYLLIVLAGLLGALFLIIIKLAWDFDKLTEIIERLEMKLK